MFREQIAGLLREGESVLLSSRILSEIEHLCDRVSIIRAGKTVESGTLAELRVAGVTVNPPSLEELFMRHYGAVAPGAHPSGSETARAQS